jgi:hypothetical protein
LCRKINSRLQKREPGASCFWIEAAERSGLNGDLLQKIRN